MFLEEDEPMLAAQAEAMGGADFWDCKPLILASDKAAHITGAVLPIDGGLILAP